jgi:hypothetical protein
MLKMSLSLTDEIFDPANGSVARIGKLDPACWTGRLRPRTVSIRPNKRDASFAKMGAQKFRKVRFSGIFQRMFTSCTDITARSRPKPRVEEQILRSITFADHNHCPTHLRWVPGSNGCAPGQCDHVLQPDNLGRIGYATASLARTVRL